MSTKRYTIEMRDAGTPAPNGGTFIFYTAIVRRPQASTIAIGVGTGSSRAEAIASAIVEVRMRRRAGQFKATDTRGIPWG